MIRKVFAVTALCGVLASANGTVYQVGPSRTYTSLQAVASLLDPGDIVEVDGNQTYTGCRFTRDGDPGNPIILRGIKVGGARPVLNANAPGFPDVLRMEGNHYVIESFEVTGTVTPLTSRGIFLVANDLTVSDCVVHDCPRHGILSADQFSGDHLIEFCEVYNCGNGTTYHSIYLATDNAMYPSAVATVRFCYIHDGVGGNSIKSRATRNEILYNWVEGALHHELELIGADPAGQSEVVDVREDSQVVGNVLRKRTGSTGALARVGGDGTGDSNGRFRFLNNTLIMGGSGTSAIRIFDHAESLEFHNNVFYHSAGTGFTLVRTVEQQGTVAHSGTNNWYPTNGTGAPAAWQNSITGTNPGFVDAPNFDFMPTGTGVIKNAGFLPTSSPAGFPFLNSLAGPESHPPLRTFTAPGTQQTRPVYGTIDIGALETTVVPAGLSLWLVD
jgi:Right handed beta helix region